VAGRRFDRRCLDDLMIVQQRTISVAQAASGPAVPLPGHIPIIPAVTQRERARRLLCCARARLGDYDSREVVTTRIIIQCRPTATVTRCRSSQGTAGAQGLLW
jgi:hypothetical protein